MKTKQYEESLFILFVGALAEALRMGIIGFTILIILLSIINLI